jgi:hypothetical protein
MVPLSRSVDLIRTSILGENVPGVIKRITVDQLAGLADRAQALGFSAVGRPAWVGQHATRIKAVALMPICSEGSARARKSCWRCYVGVSVEGDGVVTFRLDVALEEFASLPAVDTPWELAEMLLYWAPTVPVDVESNGA